MAQKPELQSEECLNAYYRTFDRTGDPEEENMVAFWKQTIYEYAYSVESKFGVKVHHLVKKFTLHSRVPCGLPLIMKELAKQGSLATREDIKTGALF